ncbi:unnamed protein product, partial [Candidula unifasciata]
GDLVCERRWMVPLTTSIQMAGLLVGGLLSGHMSDLFGRKKTLYFFTATTAVFCFFGCLLHFVLPSSRGVVTVLPSLNVGVCLMALAAWRLQDWWMLYLICGVMMTPLLLPYFFLPESLRWLTVKGRVDEAQRVVEWIARWNKQEVPKDSLDVIKAVADAVGNTDKTIKHTYIHIYKGWHLCKSSVILQFLWFTLSLCGYGFSFGVSSFGTNVNLNIFLLQVLVFWTAIVFMILASACGFGSMAVNLTSVSSWKWKATAEIMLNLFSRGMLTAAWGTIVIVTNETYPTVIRGLGFGASNVSARVGAIVSPFLLNFEEGPTLALAIVGGSLLLAALAVCFLHETSGKALAESILAAGKTTDKQLETATLQNSTFSTENAAETNNVLGDSGVHFKTDSTRM